MTQIQRRIESSTNHRVWLKSLATLYLMGLMAPREQVDLDDIDEDDVPTAAMRTMAIGDVRPQE
jgi:predicted amidohydrolase